MGSAASLLRPASSKRSRPSAETSDDAGGPGERDVGRRPRHRRARIVPAPPAQATVTPGIGPAGLSAGPMIGRWSGVKSIVAAQIGAARGCR